MLRHIVFTYCFKNHTMASRSPFLNQGYSPTIQNPLFDYPLRELHPDGESYTAPPISGLIGGHTQIKPPSPNTNDQYFTNSELCSFANEEGNQHSPLLTRNDREEELLSSQPSMERQREQLTEISERSSHDQGGIIERLGSIGSQELNHENFSMEDRVCPSHSGHLHENDEAPQQCQQFHTSNGNLTQTSQHGHANEFHSQSQIIMGSSFLMPTPERQRGFRTLSGNLSFGYSRLRP